MVVGLRAGRGKATKRRKHMGKGLAGKRGQAAGKREGGWLDSVRASERWHVSCGKREMTRRVGGRCLRSERGGDLRRGA